MINLELSLDDVLKGNEKIKAKLNHDMNGRPPHQWLRLTPIRHIFSFFFFFFNNFTLTAEQRQN